MKKILFMLLVFASCSQKQVVKNSVNGFISGTESKAKIGSQDAVEVFKKLDNAWANLDYELI